MPLGVLLLNENKVDEMTKILDCFHQYVPSEAVTITTATPDGNVVEYSDYKLVKIHLGGDQLTVSRVNGAKDITKDHENSK